MMQFVHSTLSPQHRLKHCVLLSQKLKKSFDALLVYEKFVDILSVEECESGFEFKLFQTIPIETPLLWIESLGDFILSFTSNFQFLISRYDSSMSRVASLDMSFLEEDGLSQLSYFLLSNSKHYFFVSGKTDHFYIIKIDDFQNLETRPFYMDSAEILDVTVANEPNCFVLYVRMNISDGGSKTFFIIFNAETLSVVREEMPPEDFIGFIQSTDSSKTTGGVIKKNLIEIAPKLSNPISSPIQLYSKIESGIFVCQLQSNELLVTEVDTKTITTISEAPKFDQIYVLPGKIALCCNEENNMFIGLHTIKRLSRRPQSTAKQVPFKSLEVLFEIKKNPISIQNIIYQYPKDPSEDGNLILSSNDMIYSLKNEFHIETEKAQCKVDDSSTLFAPVPDVIMSSTNTETKLLYGEVEISKKPTIAVLYVFSKHVQVCPNEIFEIDGEVLYKTASNKKIKFATGYGSRLLLALENGHVLLFHATFNDKTQIVFDDFHLATMCKLYIALCDQNTVFLYDFEFNQFADYTFPSTISSMIFCNDGRELFVALHCGAIVRISENSVNYLFTLNPDPVFLTLKSYEKFLLIFDQEESILYVYDDSRLIKTDIKDVDSIFASYSYDEELDAELNICFTKRKKQYSVVFPVHEYTTFYQCEKIKEIQNPIFFQFKDSITKTLFAFTEFNKLTTIINYDTKEEYFQIPDSVSCFTTCQKLLFVGFNRQIIALEYEKSKLEHIYTLQLDQKPLFLSSFYSMIAIGFQNEIKIAEIKCELHDEIDIHINDITLSLKAPLKSLITNGLTWAILENSTILTLTFNQKLDQFEILALGEYSNLEKFCIVDNYTIAAVKDLHIILFIRMPEKRINPVDNKTPPSFEIVGKFDAREEITSLQMVGEALIYATCDGTIHSLTVCNQFSKFRAMLEYQIKLQTEIHKLFALSVENDNSLWNQANVFDSDIVNVLPYQTHNVLSEQERCDMLMIQERWKILF